MSLGPELIREVAADIRGGCLGRKIRKAEACDAWAALSYARDGVLLLSWDNESYGACASSVSEVRELVAPSSSVPPILNALKSHLTGSEISGCCVLNNDRLLKLEFARVIAAGHRQTRYLLLEASGRYSNLLLLDEDDRIIEAAKHIHPDENRYRSILPGLDYVPPPPLPGIPIERIGDIEDVDGPFDLDALVGVGRPLIAAMKQSGLDLRRVKGLFSSPERIFQSIGHYVMVFPILLAGARTIDAKTAIDAARQTVAIPMLKKRTDGYKRRITAILDRQERIVERRVSEYERTVADETEIENLRDTGSLILANAYAIPPRTAETVLPEWTEQGEVKRKVTLDPQKTPAQNAEKYFAKYRKKKAATRLAAEHLPTLRAKREELDEQRVLLSLPLDLFVLASMLGELQAEERGAGKKGKSESLPPHRRYEVSGEDATILCGLSAKGNRYVTFRLARPDDIWMHVQGVPGSHVILRFGTAPDAGRLARMIALAASCAVYHSRAKDSGRARVDYTERKYVHSIGGTVSGVTYKEFSSIIADVTQWEEFLVGLTSSASAENPSNPPAENS